MNSIPRSPFRRAFFILSTTAVVVGLAIFTGCNRPVSAPAVKYNEADAELLQERLGKMDWE